MSEPYVTFSSENVACICGAPRPLGHVTIQCDVPMCRRCGLVWDHALRASAEAGTRSAAARLARYIRGKVRALCLGYARRVAGADVVHVPGTVTPPVKRGPSGA